MGLNDRLINEQSTDPGERLSLIERPPKMLFVTQLTRHHLFHRQKSNLPTPDAPSFDRVKTTRRLIHTAIGLHFSHEDFAFK